MASTMITSRAEPLQQSLHTKLSQHPAALAAWDDHAAANSALRAAQAAKSAAIAKVPRWFRFHAGISCMLTCTYAV